MDFYNKKKTIEALQKIAIEGQKEILNETFYNN